MKLLYSTLAGLFLVALGWPLGASAHIVRDEGTISVLLHINPNDDPVAGQASTLGFSITDTAGRFRGTDCSCRITVKEGGKKRLDRAVGSNEVLSDGAILADYKFPYQGIYTITLEGTPRQANGFQPFKLDYDVRVDQGPVKPASPWAKWGLVALVAGALMTAGFFIYGELSYSIGKKPRKRNNS